MGRSYEYVNCAYRFLIHNHKDLEGLIHIRSLCSSFIYNVLRSEMGNGFKL